MTDTHGLRIVFAGTPEFATRHLQALYDSAPSAGRRILAVYTQPDRRAGRGKKYTASSVKELALENGTKILQPVTLKDTAVQRELASLDADLMVVVAYGLLLPKPVLDIPRFGCINVHASLLPRWRGAAPIERALQAGDSETGITIMKMDAGLDTGDMLMKVACPIRPDDTAGDLRDRLAEIGPPALIKTLARIRDSDLRGESIDGEKQDDKQSCYAAKITKDEAAIDWSRPAKEIELSIRAFNPFPVAYTRIDADTVRIREAVVIRDVDTTQSPGTLLKADKQGILVACGRDAILIKNIQLPGKAAMPVSAIINGYRNRFVPGKSLG